MKRDEPCPKHRRESMICFLGFVVSVGFIMCQVEWSSRLGFLVSFGSFQCEGVLSLWVQRLEEYMSIGGYIVRLEGAFYFCVKVDARL